MTIDARRADEAVAAKLFRGFGDPTRLRIVLALLGGEARVTDLVSELGGSQSNISGHLACLKECGLVLDRPEGRQVFYRLAGDEIVDLLRAAEALLVVTGERVELCANYGKQR